MRVGIDAWGLGGSLAFSGMGRYTAALLRWIPLLTPAEVVAYGAPAEPRPPWLPDDVEWHVPGPSRLGRLAAIASRLHWITEAVTRDDIDVFHAPGVHVRPSAPPVPRVRCPLVVTVHDLIPLSHYGTTLPMRNRAFYSWNLRRAVAADQVLTVSPSAKEDIVALANIPAAGVRVVTSAVEFSPNHDRAPLRELGIASPYLLYAGSYEPRKNLSGMLEAFERYVEAGGPHLLVALTEPSSGHMLAVQATLAALSCRHRVQLVHSLEEDALRALYTHADAVVFPSLAEGLGLPAIEAAACGVPLVVSDLPALRATVGEIATLVRPGDPRSLLEGLLRVTTDGSLRRTASAAGPAIAARFSPEACVSDHLQVYRACRQGRYART